MLWPLCVPGQAHLSTTTRVPATVDPARLCDAATPATGGAVEAPSWKRGASRPRAQDATSPTLPVPGTVLAHRGATLPRSETRGSKSRPVRTAVTMGWPPLLKTRRHRTPPLPPPPQPRQPLSILPQWRRSSIGEQTQRTDIPPPGRSRFQLKTCCWPARPRSPRTRTGCCCCCCCCCHRMSASLTLFGGGCGRTARRCSRS